MKINGRILLSSRSRKRFQVFDDISNPNRSISCFLQGFQNSINVNRAIVLGEELDLAFEKFLVGKHIGEWIINFVRNSSCQCSERRELVHHLHSIFELVSL